MHAIAKRHMMRPAYQNKPAVADLGINQDIAMVNIEEVERLIQMLSSLVASYKTGKPAFNMPLDWGRTSGYQSGPLLSAQNGGMSNYEAMLFGAGIGYAIAASKPQLAGYGADNRMSYSSRPYGSAHSIDDLFGSRIENPTYVGSLKSVSISPYGGSNSGSDSKPAGNPNYGFSNRYAA